MGAGGGWDVGVTSNSTSFLDSFVVEDSTLGVSLPAHMSVLT